MKLEEVTLVGKMMPREDDDVRRPQACSLFSYHGSLTK